jgi:hypothetical protein
MAASVCALHYGVAGIPVSAKLGLLLDLWYIAPRFTF